MRRREFPERCLSAILEALGARGKGLQTMAPEEPLFDVSAHGLYLNLRRYFRKAKLPPSGVRVFRHSAAKLQRDVGETVGEKVPPPESFQRTAAVRYRNSVFRGISAPLNEAEVAHPAA